MNCPDTREDIFGKTASMGVNLHQLVFVLGVDHDADGDDDDDGGHGGHDDQRELPLHSERDDESCYEGCQGLYGQSKLFRNALVDEIRVGGDMARDGPGFGQVEEGDLLAENLREKIGSDCLGDSDTIDGDEGLGLVTSC